MTKLPCVIRPPALSFDELKQFLLKKYPKLKDGTEFRRGTYECLEVCGQSGAVTHGFEAVGLKAISFGIRA